MSDGMNDQKSTDKNLMPPPKSSQTPARKAKFFEALRNLEKEQTPLNEAVDGN